MKRCPECSREYDNTMMFCLDDGAELLYGPASQEPATAILSEPGAVATGFPAGESATRVFHTGEAEPPGQLGDSSERHSLSAHRAAEPRENPSAHRAAEPREDRVARAKDDRELDPESKSVAAQRAAKPLAAAVIATVLLVSGYFAYRYFSTARQIDSIAVMPFVNEGGNADVDYLSDGMTETLISSLTKLPNLNVKSRSSVFRYKGKDTDAKTIGNELNVQSILNGRVAQRGDQLTLTLELVDVSTENAIWSQQYSRKHSDLVSLQSEIARDVSSKLQSRLSGAEVAKIGKTSTTDPEAYQLYLRGRFQWNKRTGESLKQAVTLFEQAIARDPNFALAFSGMAETYVLFANYSVATPGESMPKAKAAALRAIELDDSLAEAHVALGMYYSDFAWNQPAAEREFRRAIELDPNYATAHHQFGIQCLTTMGRFDEAIAVGRRAEQLDPVSPIIGADLGNTLIRARRFDESIEQLKRVLEQDPNFWVAHWYLGMANFGKGRYAEAITAYEKALSLNDNPWVKALLAQSLAMAGRRNEATRLVGELTAASERRYVSNGTLALAHAAVGEKDQAFAFLEHEVADRSSRPNIFAFLVIWDDLREDPRFAALVQKVEQSRLD